MRARWIPVVALALGLVALAAWRAACVLDGPDVDTDAYAHHMIARAILADPRDLAVHWVWLPLFHYAQVPLVALGGTMDTVRWLNVLLSAALPVVLYAYLRRTSQSGASRTSPEATALVAALIAAACPIVMQMGTTAQPEPLFALLVLGAAIAFERRRTGWTAALLAPACLLRYEAWAALVAVAAVLAVERYSTPGPSSQARRGIGTGDGTSAPPRSRGGGQGVEWLAVAVPVAFILAWAALRAPVDGRWFGFLGQTRQFANDATHTTLGAAGDAFYYPLWVPFRVMGAVLPLVPFGVVRTVRQQGPRFVLVLLACLGFISLSWVTRSSLGLDRHFVCVVPLYATFAAQGAVVLADACARAVKSAAIGRAIVGPLVVMMMAGLYVQLDVWMGNWRAAVQHPWPERVALGAYLRSLPASSTIYCDDATLEILSGLDRRRFDRHWVDDPATWPLVKDRAQKEGDVYVATWRRKLEGHEDAGDTVFTAGIDPADPTHTGVAVIHVRR
jgi:hypothetical protein